MLILASKLWYRSVISPIIMMTMMIIMIVVAVLCCQCLSVKVLYVCTADILSPLLSLRILVQSQLRLAIVWQWKTKDCRSLNSNFNSQVIIGNNIFDHCHRFFRIIVTSLSLFSSFSSFILCRHTIKLSLSSLTHKFWRSSYLKHFFQQ